MADHWCYCDPQGDARCQRECCQPRHVNTAEAAAIVGKARRMFHDKPRPSAEDMAEAVEALRLLASRTRSVEVMERLARVAAWIEGERKP